MISHLLLDHLSSHLTIKIFSAKLFVKIIATVQCKLQVTDNGNMISTCYEMQFFGIHQGKHTFFLLA